MVQINQDISTFREFYIYGKPIPTKIGNLHFITVEEYYDFITKGYLTVLTMETSQLTKFLRQFAQQDKGIKGFIEFLLNTDTFTTLQIVEAYIQNEPDYQNSYVNLFGLVDYYNKTKEMFEFCFKEDVFGRIESAEEFEQYKELIREINCISYEKPNPNPEIEKYNQMKRLMQQQKGEQVTFESMYTSVGLALGRDPDSMTLYKFYRYFERIAQFKNYDTSTLFATVAEKVKIEPWYKHIEKEEDAPLTISESQLKNRNIKPTDVLTNNKPKEDR